MISIIIFFEKKVQKMIFFHIGCETIYDRLLEGSWEALGRLLELSWVPLERLWEPLGSVPDSGTEPSEAPKWRFTSIRSILLSIYFSTRDVKKYHLGSLLSASWTH